MLQGRNGFKKDAKLAYKWAEKAHNAGNIQGTALLGICLLIGSGVAMNLEAISGLDAPSEFVVAKAKEVWQQAEFNQYSGAGVRGTTRLSKLLPFAKEFLKP